MAIKPLEIILLIIAGCLFLIPIVLNIIDFVKWWFSDADTIVIQSPDGDTAKLSPYRHSREEIRHFLEVWSKLK
ncbi:hypothetical protein [uncultured Chitinophaga sp.]|uniref:hypothetical protein n=1 Tax=uncultured Chitinophaga sp. TaxID=339340 RepID=UPI0025E294F1|nr:hypothetical protein [uncultured Chitinophaga sp.]